LLIRVPLLFAFPLLSHLAVALHQPWLQCASLACAYAGVFLDPLRRGRAGAWLGLAALVGADLALQRLGQGAYLLYLPSLFIPALVLSAFAPTVLPGRVPLVTRIADSVNGPLSSAQLRYTRVVTWVWIITLVGILLTSAGLMLFWSREAWSLFANFISYLLLGALFLGEFLVRRVRFPDKTPRSLRDFLRSMSSYRPH
jgi:uncharacterized membrane protein